MAELICLTLACLLSLLGFALMALGQERHWEHVTASGIDSRISQRVLFRLGLLAQGVALPLMLYAEGPSFGALLWAVLLTGMAMFVALTLSWKPTWLMPLANRLRVHKDV